VFVFLTLEPITRGTALNNTALACANDKLHTKAPNRIKPNAVNMFEDQALRPASANITDDISGARKLSDANNLLLPFFKPMSHK